MRGKLLNTLAERTVMRKQLTNEDAKKGKKIGSKKERTQYGANQYLR